MKERRNTGGTKTFVYKNSDIERIQSTDTDSTRAFKDGLRQHRITRRIEKHNRRIVSRRLMLIGTGIVLLIVVLLLMRYVW